MYSNHKARNLEQYWVTTRSRGFPGNIDFLSLYFISSFYTATPHNSWLCSSSSLDNEMGICSNIVIKDFLNFTPPLLKYLYILLRFLTQFLHAIPLKLMMTSFPRNPPTYRVNIGLSAFICENDLKGG